MDFLPFCSPEHRDLIVSNFRKATKGENQKFEANFISGKGRKMILKISLVPLKKDGEICGLYGVAKDITRLKESEDALLKSERKFKALIQEGSDLIGILDLEGKYKFVSETSTPVLGIPPQEFIGKTAFDYMHPEDQERVTRLFSELKTKKQIEIGPFRFMNSKGEWRWVETKATNLTDDPAVEGIVVNSRDITDHIKTQKAIKESEERFRSFFENSLDAIMVTLPNGEILAANPSACNMFQRSEKEICALGRNGILDPDDPALIKVLKTRRETGMATAELTFIRKDGTKFPGEVTTSIFRDAEGKERSTVTIRDITERKNTEVNLLALNKNLKKFTKELIKANKDLEQFSYIISHNLRAPVANIIGLSQLLNGEDYSQEVKMKFKEEIEVNAHRIDNVIKDLNQVLQVKHDFSEVKQYISLNEIVNSIKTNLQETIKREDITITTDFREVEKINSISSFIYSIFFNLIFNSIKFRHPERSAVIDMTAEKKNGTVRFIFKDNGLGVDLDKKRGQIFGLYKRFHHHIEGKGMGLFMVKTQVEMIGGKISIASKVNRGSTFILEFGNEILRP